MYECCLKLNVHLPPGTRGGWGSAVFWVELGSSRKFSYIIIPPHSLAISHNSAAGESLHRFLLWERILPRTAGKDSGMSLPYLLPPPPQPFMGITGPKKGSWGQRSWQTRGSGQGTIPGMLHNSVGWISTSPFSRIQSQGLGCLLLFCAHHSVFVLTPTCSLPWFNGTERNLASEFFICSLSRKRVQNSLGFSQSLHCWQW